MKTLKENMVLSDRITLFLYFKIKDYMNSNTGILLL